MAIAYLSLGSNKNDRVSYLQQAVKLLCESEKVRLVRGSAFYETEPWGNKEQDWFVNAVIEVRTEFSPEKLLEHCQRVEKILGRTRENTVKWGSREIDIDILFYDKLVLNTHELQIPHQYLHRRAFALVPLLELIPGFVHPIFGKTLLDLHSELDSLEDVYLYGAKVNEFS